ncbi:MAG TPA: endonuclease III [Dehalococcoidia bacterium]|nr:endonuclease III [Dehalococcoidia bacterium]
MATTVVPYTPDEVVQRLQALYGAPEWRPHGDAMSELVLTLLSQNTADTNSGRAFSRLLQRFPDWPSVLEAPLSEVEDAIRPGGLAPTKAPRLQAMLAEIKQRTGGFDLRFLEDLPVDQAREWLRSLPAVGPKTAACVLLFGLGMPGLPVDTHVHRVSIRLGLVGKKMTPEQAQLELESRVPADEHYMFHILLIRHGRHICGARSPSCRSCPLLERCPAGQSFLPAAGPKKPAAKRAAKKS